MICPKTNLVCRNIECYELDKPTSFLDKIIACDKIRPKDVFYLINKDGYGITIKVEDIK